MATKQTEAISVASPLSAVLARPPNPLVPIAQTGHEDPKTCQKGPKGPPKRSKRLGLGLQVLYRLSRGPSAVPVGLVEHWVWLD